MKTETLYYDYPFDKTPESITVKVLESRPVKGQEALILDKTIFYPEGGGQPSDRGTINGIPVLDVREEEGEILHFIEKTPEQGGARPGENAELKLDIWRRRDITVQHSAQHLLSGTLFCLAGIPTVSMHLGVQYSTIDINCPSMDREILIRIEDAAINAIGEDRPFIIHLCPPERAEDLPLRKAPPKGEEQLRIVEIGKPGAHKARDSKNNPLDFSPCCGTHVSSAGQIGMLRILETEKYKGMIRMTFIAGRRCFNESRMLRDNAVCISQLLKVPVEETGKAAAALLEKTNRLEGRLAVYEEEAAKKDAAEILTHAHFTLPGEFGSVKSPDLYAESFPGKEMEELLRIGKQLQKITEAVIVLGSEKEFKFAAVCPAKGADIRGLFKTAVENAGGKGGGGPSFFQGQFDKREKYRAFFAELKKL